jgi:antitoxin FitA
MFMQTLHVRSVPEELYNRLRALAQAKQRSLSAQVILLLDRALEDEAQHQDQAQILAELRRRRFTPSPAALDSIEMLHEDRER